MTSHETITHISGDYYHQSCEGANYIVFLKEGHDHNKYVNGSAICSKYEKRIRDWISNKITLSIKTSIIKRLPSLKMTDLAFYTKHSSKTSVNTSGVYIHPLLVNALMIWINPSFILNISHKLESLHNQHTTLKKVVQDSQKNKFRSDHNHDRVIEIQKLLSETTYQGALCNVICFNMSVHIVSDDTIAHIVSYGEVPGIIGDMLLCIESHPNKHIILYVYDVPENNIIQWMMRAYSKYGIYVRMFVE